MVEARLRSSHPLVQPATRTMVGDVQRRTSSVQLLMARCDLLPHLAVRHVGRYHSSLPRLRMAVVAGHVHRTVAAGGEAPPRRSPRQNVCAEGRGGPAVV